MATLSQNAIDWAAGRGIGQPTLERFGVGSGETAMPGLGKCEVIAFPYKRQGTAINVKYRALSTKAFKQREGGELRFWNLDAVLSGKAEEVYVTEGEMDALALAEAGFPPEQIVSVPNGAPREVIDEPPELDAYRYVFKGVEEGFKPKRYVLVTDNDPKGRALRHDLARLLGPARCLFVEWPDGIKDANEFLQRHGGADLNLFVREDAREWPVEGLYRLSELPEPPPMEIWRPGFPEWGSKVAFGARTVSIVTGHPGHGKTHLMGQCIFQICRDYQLTAALASFETRPRPHHRRNVRRFMYGKLERDLTDDEMRHADQWIDEHMLWLVHPARRPSFRWWLDTAEAAVVRNNARFIQLDPWNRLESDRPDDMRETDWIGQCLDEAADFAHDMNCHVQILAHPAKSGAPRSKRERPELEDIAGSKHWDNKPDLGLCVHRPKMADKEGRSTKADLYVLKARFEELGYPCRLSLDFDLQSCRFVSTDYQKNH